MFTSNSTIPFDATASQANSAGIIHGSEHNTDLGNARCFTAEHGHNVRYCPAWGKWLVWDETHWKIDDTGEVNRLAKETVGSMYQQGAKLEDGERQKRIEHALRSENASRLQAMLNVATTEPGIPVRDRYPLSR